MTNVLSQIHDHLRLAATVPNEKAARDAAVKACRLIMAHRVVLQLPSEKRVSARVRLPLRVNHRSASEVSKTIRESTRDLSEEA